MRRRHDGISCHTTPTAQDCFQTLTPISPQVAQIVTCAIRDTEESRASAGEPSCRSRHRSSASAAQRSALPRGSAGPVCSAHARRPDRLRRAALDGLSSGGGAHAARRRRARSAAGSSAVCLGAWPAGHVRASRSSAPARRCSPAFGGPRRRAGARNRCGCSATSSVVPDGSRAFYHQPLPRLPPSAPSLELSEAAS